MAWNPYTDQRNRAYSSILTTLFPEQTRTLPRILLWSVIFLLDLILVIGFAYSRGWIGNDYMGNHLTLFGIALVGATVGIFWLQGFLWGKLVRFFQKRNELG